MKTDTNPPAHHTREPWWVIFVAPIALPVALVYAFRLGIVGKAHSAGVSVLELLAGSAGFALVAAIILWGRSHVKRKLWANLLLAIAMIVAAVAISAGILALR